jgi:hypothetical protein
VSYLTRNAMRDILNGVNRECAFGTHLDEFRNHMKSLDNKVEQLMAEIRMFKTGSNH